MLISSVGRSLHPSTCQLLSEFSISMELMFIRLTKESKTGALRSSAAWESVITNSHLENYLFLQCFCQTVYFPHGMNSEKLVSRGWALQTFPQAQKSDLHQGLDVVKAFWGWYEKMQLYTLPVFCFLMWERLARRSKDVNNLLIR